MPTTLDTLRDAFTRAIRGLSPDLYDVDPAVVPSGNPQFGDYQCNAAMALAKKLGQKPRDVAQTLVTAIGNVDGAAEKIDIAGPGFINVTLSPAWLTAKLNETAADERLGVPLAPSPSTVVVDYSGPNVAKELAVHHIRSTIIGDTVARVLLFLGHNVKPQNHIGDWGTQFGMLIAYGFESGQFNFETYQSEKISAPVTSGSLHSISDLEEFYRRAKAKFDADPEFQQRARETVVRLQSGKNEEKLAWRFIVDETRASYQPLYERLHVLLNESHEKGESSYNNDLRRVVDELKDKHQLATESEGAIGVFIDGEKKPPLIVEKTGGGFLYGTTDLAAVRYRVDKLEADRVLYFTDARQAQHFSQVFRTAEKAGWTKGTRFEHAPFGAILGRDGKPFKTRSGGTVKLKDLLDEAVERARTIVEAKNPDLPEAEKAKIAEAIGIGSVKYADLSKDRSSDYVFDFDAMLAMDGNTGPYLQYAHARTRSILRKAGDFTPGAPIAPAAPEEFTLAKHILRLGETIDSVARDLKPHVLCLYLYELAQKFSGFYEKCPVLKSDEPTRSSRLALCDLTARTLALGLDLLGIEHPEQM